MRINQYLEITHRLGHPFRLWSDVRKTIPTVKNVHNSPEIIKYIHLPLLIRRSTSPREEVGL
jgi:hypothetical protein